jgi:hypothetical protein
LCIGIWHIEIKVLFDVKIDIKSLKYLIVRN